MPLTKRLNLLIKVNLRVAEKNDNEWVVNQWVKKAIMLSFRTHDMDSLAVAHIVVGMTNLIC